MIYEQIYDSRTNYSYEQFVLVNETRAEQSAQSGSGTGTNQLFLLNKNHFPKASLDNYGR